MNQNGQSREALLKKVQSYTFAALDLHLYLDTHPDDKKALEMFRDMVIKSKELIDQFEKSYGPLTANSSANFESFKWILGPWPWEKEAN